MKILKAISIIVFITFFAIGCGSSGGGGTKTTSVSGTVTDINGVPVQGAIVTITSTPVTATTNSSGYFSATVEVGDHHISIKVGTDEIYSYDFNCTEEPYSLATIPTQYDPNAIYPDADGDGHYSNLDCDDNNANVKPGATETCDGIDNNCDGAVDEGVTNACGSCGAVPTEICDGKDNNCDGTTDEGCNCTDGSTLICGSDIGECSTGTQTCVNGQWNSCSGEVGPSTEICGDELDQDCSGSDLACPIDTDGDGISDANDNCPNDSNADQIDTDKDGIGDVCDNNDGSLARGYITDRIIESGEIDITITSTNFECGPDEVRTHTQTVTVDATTMTWIEGEMTWTRNAGDPSDIRGTWRISGNGESLTLIIANDYSFTWTGIIDCENDGDEVLELMGVNDINDDGKWYLTKINTTTGATTLVNTSPFLQGGELTGEGTAIDIDEDIAYITGEDANMLSGIFVIDLKTGLLLRTLNVDAVDNIFFNSADELMGIFTEKDREKVVKINTVTGATTIISTLPSEVSTTAEGTAIDLNEDVAYITGGAEIFVIDLKTGELLKTLLSSDLADHNDYFETIFVNSAGELMGLPNEYYLGALMKINTTTGETTIINSSPYPVMEFIGESTAIDTNEDVAYVDGGDLNWQGTIYVIDLKTGILLRTLSVDAGETIFFHMN